MEEKLQPLKQLVHEKIDAHHMEESNSPWHSPVFVEKKSGK